MRKEPGVIVPASILLGLIRAYKEQPQEVCEHRVWLIADRLERIAYRKYLSWKHDLKKSG